VALHPARLDMGHLVAAHVFFQLTVFYSRFNNVHLVVVYVGVHARRRLGCDGSIFFFGGGAVGCLQIGNNTHRSLDRYAALSLFILV
jgi:hypothetical protein